MRIKWILIIGLTCWGTIPLGFGMPARAETANDYRSLPPFASAGPPPLVMMVMGRDHKLFYEAYNDASDLDEDGRIDVGYNPAITYYGYFDPYKCYLNPLQDGSHPLFIPSDDQDPSVKTCGGDGEWSGNYLNYLSMSRIDVLRKVLYGGYRTTDSQTETILERAFIPQDTHSWGKEYQGIDQNGYDIRDYTPLPLPEEGTRHLFASTTLAANGDPLLRVLPNNTHRIWEWVSAESGVGIAEDWIESEGGTFDEHPRSHAQFEEMVLRFAINAHQEGVWDRYDHANLCIDCESACNPFGSDDHYLTIFTGKIAIATGGVYEFAVDGDDAVEVLFDNPAAVVDEGTPIDPLDPTLSLPYEVSSTNLIDPGTELVTVLINEDRRVVLGWYGDSDGGGHGRCNCQDRRVSLNLAAGSLSFEFRHEEVAGGDNYALWYRGADTGGVWQKVPADAFAELRQGVYNLDLPPSSIEDYQVRVRVCGAADPEQNCKQYPSGVHKPVGLLQTQGESERMHFGLISGSYTHHLSGGVLRRNIGPISEQIDPATHTIDTSTGEIDTATGRFKYHYDSTTGGIIKTLDHLTFINFDYSTRQHDDWIYNRPIQEGENRMWGNPVAEMMYESLRYFAGTTPTEAFSAGIASGDDSGVDLPLEDWQDPYGIYPQCSKPFMLVISDVNPSYDTDQVPGNYAFWDHEGNPIAVQAEISLNGASLNAAEIANQISDGEEIGGRHYIGQQGSVYDAACSAKTVNGFGDIRGLCPEEPTKLGGYYSAAMAYYGRRTDINAAAGPQNVFTYTVGLSSPLPRIEVPLSDGRMITLLPFAKSIESSSGGTVSPERGSFQPTCAIADFYVESIAPTHGRFRVNFEHAEQGADFDMDAIVLYEYQLNADDTVTVSVKCLDYNGGSTKQHLGYIISGTTADGIYLEVRSTNYHAEGDPDYYLDTPPGIGPNAGPGDTNWDDDTALPTQTVRTFAPGGELAATLLENPLFYAAKWGGFEDENAPESPTDYLPVPDLDEEWDKDGNALPDTYFHVTNPLKLERQLQQSFADILRKAASGTAASVISSTRSGEGAIYQSVFYPEYKGTAGRRVNWSGEVHAMFVDDYGNMREDSDGNQRLDLSVDRVVVFDGATVKKHLDADGNGIIDADETDVRLTGLDGIRYLWSARRWLNEIGHGDLSGLDIAAQRSYGDAAQQRYIITLVDADQDQVADAGEVQAFVSPSLPSVTDLTDVAKIYPYLQPHAPFEPLSSDLEAIRMRCEPSGTGCEDFHDYLRYQSQRIVNFIRGLDQAALNRVESHGYRLPPLRPRRVDDDQDGVVETWRLGDIVYSTPTYVGRPAEGYHLIYHDESYARFADRYQRRRGVVYTGANDGMLHAFNAGFYDRGEDSVTGDPYSVFQTQPLDADGNPDSNYTGHMLGAELWAYIPYNLLPHLLWLTETTYTESNHVYYCDLKPKVFDAQIFAPSQVHPGGWGTVLVGGMRLGGGTIRADMDKTDGLVPTDSDRSMRSAYFILDITDPEQPPDVLAEIAFDHLGYTTCYPAVIPMKDTDDLAQPGQWYLLFGSGPAESDGSPGIRISLTEAASSQNARLFVVDLVELATNGNLQTLDASGVRVDGDSPFQTLDSNGFISDPISVDYNLDFRADAVYFGTVTGEGTESQPWGGRLRRVVIDNDPVTTNWVQANGKGSPTNADNVLLDLTGLFADGSGQPITAAPSVAIDGAANRWIYVGTGRFFTRADARNVDLQSYYGIREPVDPDDGTATWDWVGPRSELLDVTAGQVRTDIDSVSGITASIGGVTTSVETWSELEEAVLEAGGWYLDLAAGERNIGQAALLGDLVIFTGYLPSSDACSFEGTSRSYVLNFITGTADESAPIGSVTLDEEGSEEALAQKEADLGQGLSITPNFHIGREKGSRTYIQTSTGAIITIDTVNPGDTKSGVFAWEEGGCDQ